ncbi:MAG: DUF3662 domain-containing protein [Selenomonadaceae bacterium]|nr:DUF3662 domain-containing protein [Selenomonadaceae bacterium]MBP3722032.1 DUF3662 domain-containing protein [Selenomonadaceae bacterium]
MSFLKMESFFKNNVENLINKYVHPELEPKKLFQTLEKEIIANSKKIADEVISPNDFTIFLEEKNYGRLSSKRIIDALFEVAERKIIKDDLFMDGELKIRIQKDMSIKEGEIKIQSLFLEEHTNNNPIDSHTLVLERKKFDAPLNLPTSHSIANLTVIDGVDKGLSLELTEKNIYIGRREKSDLFLNDDKISRLHAYISYERHRHIFVDADSLNGSYIDDERIQRTYLLNGDKIRIGETVLLYEVI